MDISLLKQGKDILAWVPVEEGIRVLCRHITQAKWEELKKAATTVTVVDAAKGETQEDCDPVEFRHLVGQFAVVDTEGLTDGCDGEGKPVKFEVTVEGVNVLMDHYTEFRVAVMSAPLKLSTMLKLAAEQTGKNS